MSLADHLEAMNLTRGAGSIEVRLLAQVAESARTLLAEYERSCAVVGSRPSDEAVRLRHLLVDLDIARAP